MFISYLPGSELTSS